MKNIKNKIFFITSIITASIFCITSISIPVISLASHDNKNDVQQNKPNPKPDPTPDPNPGPTLDPDPNPKPDPEPEPEPEPTPPPVGDKVKTNIVIINDSSLIGKYLIKNRINDVKNHFENLNGQTPLGDIWDKFNDVLFKTSYKSNFVEQAQSIFFRCDNSGNDSYRLIYQIQLKQKYVFEDNTNKKQFTINFSYTNFVPPALTPIESDFKTINEVFDKIGGYDGQKSYSLSFPILTNANSLGSEEKNKQLITNFINRYDKLSILDFLMRQEFIYQLMSFVFSNFNENIYDWQFYVDNHTYNKISISFNLKNDVTISEWKNNIFGSNISSKTFSKNDVHSITISYKEMDLVNPWKMTASDFVKNKVWYDNNGNKKIISNSPQISIPFVSLDFSINKSSYISIQNSSLTTIPYTMFWDFVERDSTIFNRSSNAVDLDENSFGLAPAQIKMGNNYDVSPDIFPIDFDIQYSKNDISNANSLIARAFSELDYNVNYEILSQLRYFVNYNFNGLYSKEDTYKINDNDSNKIIYETQIKLEKDRTQGLFFKLLPNEWFNNKHSFKRNDILKVRIERFEGTGFNRIDNPGFYYLGYDWNIISNPLNYDNSSIKNYLDSKRFPPTKSEDRKNATLSAQLELGKFNISIDLIRDGKTSRIINWSNFVFRHVSLSMPISYNYYIKK